MFKQFFPEPTVLIDLEPEEIGRHLLIYLKNAIKNDNNRNKIHLSHHINDGNSDLREYAGTLLEPIIMALAEAWGWLEQQNILCPMPNDSSNGWVFISRRGMKIESAEDFKKFSHISLLPKSVLDPILAEKVWTLFVSGNFDTAVFAAFKEVEIRMRDASGYDNTWLGTKLARAAFHAETGQLTDKTNPDGGEKQGYSDLFAGAMGVFKSPSDHRNIDYDNPVTVTGIILFANTLLQIIEKRKAT